jgi:predicted GIY-YIG superfamily endonuclease
MSTQTLYRFFDADGSLLYVGITDTWYQRFHEHERKSGWFSKVASCTFESHETREKVMAAELIAIRSENPEFNQLHNPAYESRMDHFAKLKSWTFTGLTPDEQHAELVKQMKHRLLHIKGKQSKWVAMAFLDLFYDLGPEGVFSCRNCVALANASNVNTWHSDAYFSLEKTNATN